jgi:hypothetical protein
VTISAALSQINSVSDTQTRFLQLLPRIRQHGQVYFRDIKCPTTKEEMIAEMLALCWKWFIRLLDRGKDPAEFPSALATFAARAVKSGRRLCGQEKPKDVLSPHAQQAHHFQVFKLPRFMGLTSTPFQDALIANTQTPPDEQAAFRIDFPRWLSSLDQHRRRIAEDLLMGERTLDVANRHGCSSARISQLRREFMEDWEQFCGE